MRSQKDVKYILNNNRVKKKKERRKERKKERKKKERKKERPEYTRISQLPHQGQSYNIQWEEMKE